MPPRTITRAEIQNTLRECEQPIAAIDLYALLLGMPPPHSDALNVLEEMLDEFVQEGSVQVEMGIRTSDDGAEIQALPLFSFAQRPPPITARVVG